MISHWLPFLLFSVWSGALADRFDPRRIIQIGMVLFMLASLGWGVLFLTDTLEMWHAMVLLVVHGFAGVLWAPGLAAADPRHRRRGAAAKRRAADGDLARAGLLARAGGRAGLLLASRPGHRHLLNALIYLPLTLWLWKAPYGPRFRKGKATRRATRSRRRAGRSCWRRCAHIAGNRVIVSMTLLAGGASFFVGNGYQPQMPEFAHDLGHGDPELLLQHAARRRRAPAR